MHSSPNVCVCIPAYNYARYLVSALDSVIAQTYSNWEIVVCDNCSTDNTEEVIDRYRSRLGPRLRYYRNERNIGALANFNRCRELARGDYVMFLCADDALHPGALMAMVRALDEHPTAAIATAFAVQDLDEDDQEIGPVYSKRMGPGLVCGREVLLAQCRFSGVIGPPSQVLLRLASLGPGDLYDPRFEQNSDNALWCALCEHWDVVYVREALIYARYHRETNTLKFMQSGADIRSRAALFRMLFKESPTLRGQPWLRYQFVTRRLYPWFERAIQAARQGDWRKSLWILRTIASFSWVPWWFPYFLCISIRSSLSSHLRRRRRMDHRSTAR